MEEITIRGQKFDKSEVEKRGARKILIISNVFRWLGLTIFLMGFLPFITILLLFNGHMMASYWMYTALTLFPHIIVGFIFFCVSFKKRNALQYGIQDIEQDLPEVDKTVVVQVSNIQDLRPSDKFEEIKKYKELLDQGIISQEEFDDKKRELLG